MARSNERVGLLVAMMDDGYEGSRWHGAQISTLRTMYKLQRGRSRKRSRRASN